VGRNMVHEQVWLEIFVDVLSDRCLCLVLSKIILTLSNMMENEKVTSVRTLLFVQLLNCDASWLGLFEANKASVW
jgi:hypothetical protein